MSCTDVEFLYESTLDLIFLQETSKAECYECPQWNRTVEEDFRPDIYDSRESRCHESR